LGAGVYRLRVHGPNGFLREFAGDAGGDVAQVESRYEAEPGVLVLRLGNAGERTCELEVAALDYAAPEPPLRLSLAPRQWHELRLPLAASDHWYDLQVRMPGSGFRRRLAGHLETGRPSRSDPAIGRA
nr:phospholipase C, phosphocholine-specific [Xanthomonadaceae bacterium]